FWQDTLAQYETALKQLISSLRGFEPSPQGFIRQSFLEHDVEQGLKQAETITRDLTAEGNRIMDSVSDIVALPRLNDSAFVQQVKTAEQHEQETLERLHEFDRQGSYSLEATSQDLHTLHRTIQEISTLFERRELVLSQYRPSQLALKLSILPIPNLERFLSYSLSSVQTNLEEQGLTTNPAATANDSVHETEANWRGWLSGGLDFIPGISNIKSGIEALTGKDFITGRDIGNLERGVLLAAIFGGPIAKGGVKVFKWGGKQLDKIKHVLNPDKVMETGKAVLAKVKQGFNSLRNTAAGLMKKIADTPLPTPQFAMAGGAKMPQATIGDAVNSAKNSVMNFAQKVKDGVGKGAGKSNLKVQFTKEQLATKPSYSPAPDKWTKKGGTVKIVEDGTWVYTNKKGQTVRYPDGYPDFTEYAHPSVQPVEIEIASPTNRPMDYKSANKKAGLNK
ncbi:T7SS effector LXG polymorphic toxin, partial [Streptomyces sp. NPDC056697]|uniref:T7SS effector LXG polymorphic toxin n=1 Tax=Streptomyces sp. NPDC056697 TaxID=3345915 RepID=UPI0036D3D49A